MLEKKDFRRVCIGNHGPKGKEKQKNRLLPEGLLIAEEKKKKKRYSTSISGKEIFSARVPEPKR